MSFNEYGQHIPEHGRYRPTPPPPPPPPHPNTPKKYKLIRMKMFAKQLHSILLSLRIQVAAKSWKRQKTGSCKTVYSRVQTAELNYYIQYFFLNTFIHLILLYSIDFSSEAYRASRLINIFELKYRQLNN